MTIGRSMSDTYQDISGSFTPQHENFQTRHYPEGDSVPVVISIFEMNTNPDLDKLIEERNCDWSDRETRKWFLFRAGKCVRTKQYIVLEPYVGPTTQFRLWRPGVTQ